MKLGKNQKVFLSYAWTGEDQTTVQKRMESIVDILEAHEIPYYYNQLDSDTEKFTAPGQYVKHALEKLKDCGALMAVVSSERRSQGQLMEIGAALYAGLPVFVAMHQSATGTGYLEDQNLSDFSFTWSSEDDLLKGIEELL
ncbi:toll/interleukin-1 receptor domain-containing protein [Candidatus Saccharibacteria bacterium]|nr:toll/interleukin-1 receptor domain-containing protein [Candidatus Saccharibacteria bacterium]